MLLLVIGFAIGALGTLIGVGGGIFLVPVLLHLFPEAPSAWVGGVSMGMIALNATSGSISYYLRRTVHVRAALAFILASVPGSVLGVMVERQVDRALFEKFFGGAMIAFAALLLFRGRARRESGIHSGTRLSRSFYIKGMLISLVVGFVASFLSIGGGVIHVPLLTYALGFPVHLATGTSHFILGCTAWFALITHLFNGDVSLRDPVLWQVGISAAAGAQLGARLSVRVSGASIMRILAVVLMAVGARLIWKS